MRALAAAGAVIIALAPIAAGAADAPPARTPERFGIELNPSMLISSLGNRLRDDDAENGFETYLTGTLSAALTDRYEIAVPFAFVEYEGRSGKYSADRYALHRVDVQLRRYRTAERDGLYAGLLARFSRLESEPHDADEAEEAVAFSRAGAGIVLGFRVVPDTGRSGVQVFWGANLHLGLWLAGDPTPLDYFLVRPLEDHETGFVNVEFAKIGLRF